MSMMGKINHLLGLNITQYNEGIFINQEIYMKNLLVKFRMKKCSEAKVSIAFGTKLTRL